jgi:hypothetical protein
MRKLAAARGCNEAGAVLPETGGAAARLRDRVTRPGAI